MLLKDFNSYLYIHPICCGSTLCLGYPKISQEYPSFTHILFSCTRLYSGGRTGDVWGNKQSRAERILKEMSLFTWLILPDTRPPSLVQFSRDILGFVTFSKQCRRSPLSTKQGVLQSWTRLAVRLWKGGAETGVIKQPDLVLIQHREESVSVTSHYRLKEGWRRELKNNLKEITNTFTSHKPPMSTKWSRKYSCGFMEGKNWSPCFQHRRYLFSYTPNIWHQRKLAVDRRWEKE